MSDSAIAPLWLAINALLASAVFVLTRRLFPTDTRLQLFGHAVLLGYASIVAVGTVLGACGLLYSWALLSTATVVSGFILALSYRASAFELSARARAGGAGAGGIAVACGPSSVKPPAATLSALFGWGWGTLLLGCVAGHIALGGLWRFPSDWDTLMYHLPLVDHWLQAGSLYAPNGLHWYCPGNNELITLWCVAPFSGDFLYALTNLPATALLVCGSLEVSRQVGMCTVPRHFVALAVAANYVVQQQMLDVENDVAVAGLFLASLGYGFRYSATGRTPDLVLAATALGLLSGVKYYALGYAAVAASTTIGLIVWRQGWRKGVRATGTALGGILAFGSYWYLRNLVVTGSPFYPLGAASAGDDIRAGYPDMWATTFAGNGSADRWRLAAEAVWRMTGPCHFVAFLSFPLSAAWLLMTAGGRHVSASGTRPSATRAAVAVAAVGACGVLLITPFAVEDSPGSLNQLRWGYCPVRYGMCFLCLAMVGFGVLLSDLIGVAPRFVNVGAAPCSGPLGRQCRQPYHRAFLRSISCRHCYPIDPTAGAPPGCPYRLASHRCEHLLRGGHHTALHESRELAPADRPVRGSYHAWCRFGSRYSLPIGPVARWLRSRLRLRPRGWPIRVYGRPNPRWGDRVRTRSQAVPILRVRAAVPGLPATLRAVGSLM